MRYNMHVSYLDEVCRVVVYMATFSFSLDEAMQYYAHTLEGYD